MSHSARLNQVLAAGLARPVAPTGGGARPHAWAAPVGGRSSKDRKSHEKIRRDAIRESSLRYYKNMPDEDRQPSSRVVLKIAGLTNNIKPEKLGEGIKAVLAFVKAKGVTTIVWDGDLLNYPRKNGSAATLAFTAVLPVLHEKFPHLEFIYFKKKKSMGKLLASAAPSEDDYGNMLGPYDFLTFANTENLEPNEGIYHRAMPDQNFAVGFSNNLTRDQLGLAGLEWLKNKAGVNEMHYFVLGMGAAVESEIQEVANNPDRYPSGIAQKRVEFLGLEIKNARA